MLSRKPLSCALERESDHLLELSEVDMSSQLSRTLTSDMSRRTVQQIAPGAGAGAGHP